MLFDATHNGGGYEGDPNYEFGCVLDEFMDAANRVYARRDFFRMFYADALQDQERDHFKANAFKRIKFILRELKKGADPTEIALKLKEDKFNWR